MGEPIQYGPIKQLREINLIQKTAPYVHAPTEEELKTAWATLDKALDLFSEYGFDVEIKVAP